MNPQLSGIARRRHVRRSSFALALLLGSCATVDHTPDFAANELFYVDVPFRTKAPGDRSLFVTPVRDGRTAATLPLHERGFPIRYDGDEFWQRPVAEMTFEVLQRQLSASGLFPSVDATPSAETLVLKPTLVAFTTGAVTAMSGQRSFADVALRIEVLGPAGADGERPVWHDEVYGSRQMSELQLSPPSPYRLVGRALAGTLQQLLVGLDGSNVGRSHVPVDVLLPNETRPSEASTERR